MKILSLFDGMACGMIAMLNAGIEVESYDAYEIDEYAIRVSSHNFPNIKHHGDVFEADFTQYEGVDYLVGGSPCTYWSIAQKNNRETEASGIGWELFSQYVRAVKEAKPKFFIYENNRSMSKAIRASIDKAFGFEAVCINSALVSAQNRQRLYWVGKRNDDGTYIKVNVEQPQDRGVLLKDILESGEAWQNKSFAYTTRCQAAIPHDTLEKHRHTMVAEPVAINTTAEEDKARTLMAGYYKYGTATLLTNPGFTGGTTAVAEPVEFGNGKPIKAVSVADGKTYTVYEVKDGQITIKGKKYPIKLTDGYYIIRKLTVRECMRLQTVPEWYDFDVISLSQAYKCLGNGWTCDVITHLINATKTAARRKWLQDLLGDCL